MENLYKIWNPISDRKKQLKQSLYVVFNEIKSKL
jgi:hypothetical protein